ncbi:MAG: hypothetical protein WCJ01_03495 [Ignavibacteria bacterium]
MTVSNRSFATRAGRFNSACSQLTGVIEYTPSNTLITLPNLAMFLNDIDTKNENVTLSQQALDDLREARRHASFINKDENPVCMESLIKMVFFYIQADIEDSTGTLKIIKHIIDKMEPESKKALPPVSAETTDENVSHSTSERTFAAIIDYGKQVLSLINGIGAGYNPSNDTIKVVNFSASVTALETLRTDITTAEQMHNNSITARKNIYDGATGMSARTVMIKNFLASLPNKKKNQNYINFSRTLRGV